MRTKGMPNNFDKSQRQRDSQQALPNTSVPLVVKRLRVRCDGSPQSTSHPSTLNLNSGNHAGLLHHRMVTDKYKDCWAVSKEPGVSIERGVSGLSAGSTIQ